MNAQPCVVVLDDERFARELLVHELRPWFQVVEAAHPDTVSRLLDVRRICAVISDRDLGTERDGLAVLEEVRARRPDCARILISGSLDLSLVDQALGTGLVHRFVAKPWYRGQLLLAVRAHEAAWVAGIAGRQAG
jgi:DNA-binding NtrC family response regulator